MAQSEWLPQIDPQLCNGCGLCIDLCPTNALDWQGEIAVLAAPERCDYCATCETVCPTEAIELPYLVCLADSSRR
jgi:ferredoxin